MKCGSKKKPKKFSAGGEAKKYTEGGWSTSVSFDPEDAKRRAEQWAKDHPPKPKPKVVRPSVAPAASAEPSGAQKFIEHFKGMQQVNENRPRPAPKVDRAVRPTRKFSSNDNDMMADDAPSRLRREVAAATLSAAAGPVLGRALSVPKTGGFVGKAGGEALKGLASRGRAVRLNQAKKYAMSAADAVRSAIKRGAGYSKGGMVRGDGCAAKGKTKGRFC